MVEIDSSEIATEEVLFHEPGPRWRAAAYVPILCLVLLGVEVAVGVTPHWFALLFCGALLGAFGLLQVYAGRIHVSVELTPTALRCGAETLPVRGIAEVLPPDSDEPWEDARALGELTGVPRRRTAVPLRRTDGELVRAWAKNHRSLRTELEKVVAGTLPG